MTIRSKVGALLLCLFLGQAALAQNATDVSLGEGGVLTARVIGAHGGPLANQSVQLTTDQGNVIRLVSDQNGYVSTSGMNGCNVTAECCGNTYALRTWDCGTAPRNACSQVQLAPKRRHAPVARAARAGAKAGNRRLLFLAGATGLGLGLWGLSEIGNDDDSGS